MRALAMVFNLPQYANSLFWPHCACRRRAARLARVRPAGSVPLMRYVCKSGREGTGVLTACTLAVPNGSRSTAIAGPMEIDGEAAGFAPIEINVEPGGH